MPPVNSFYDYSSWADMTKLFPYSEFSLLFHKENINKGITKPTVNLVFYIRFTEWLYTVFSQFWEYITNLTFVKLIYTTY